MTTTALQHKLQPCLDPPSKKPPQENSEAREYSFTVVFEPVSNEPSPIRRRPASRKVHKFKAPSASGYQVTVPLLPGLITYGRTLAEAREMARDAIRCYIKVSAREDR